MLSDFVNGNPSLVSERLVLRTMVKEDVPALEEWIRDRAIYKYWGQSMGRTDKNPSLMFQKEKRATKSFHWGIALRETNKVIGEFWVYLIENNRMAKVAYRIGEQYKGNGYATEALQMVVKFCFEQTELKRLWTDVDVRNIASCKVLEKGGFSKEGLIREGKMVSTYCDHYLFGLLRSDLYS